MKDAVVAYRRLMITGSALLLTLFALSGVAVTWLEARIDGAAPKLDGTPNVLRTALQLPSEGFPPIPDRERDELARLIPIDRPIRIGSPPAWIHPPEDPDLGARDARSHPGLRRALDAMRELESTMRDAPDGDLALDDALVARVRTELAIAESTVGGSARWLVHYNRGVLYRWQGVRPRATVEFRRAYQSLPEATAGASEEVRSARIHTLYGWSDSLVRVDNGDPVVSQEVIRLLRDAAIEAAALARSEGAERVANAAGFFSLRPTLLSTAVLRNDLIAGYLEVESYAACTIPFSLQVCTARRFSGRCQYRDTAFCGALDKAPDTIRDLYEDALTRLSESKDGNEADVWALQNVAEVASENDVAAEPELSYNVAYLLLRLRQPKVAHDFIAAAIAGSDPERITETMRRLAFVTSILAGEEPTAMPGRRRGASVTPMREAYLELYPSNGQPRPFPPLVLDEVRKTEALDAWLFVRRYRFLLEQADYERFLREFENLRSRDVPSGLGFLSDWKRQTAVQFIQHAAARREQTSGAEREAINRWLARADVFTDEELASAGVARPFSMVEQRRWAYRLAGVAHLALVVAFVWLCAAYKRTCVSAYRHSVPADPAAAR